MLCLHIPRKERRRSLAGVSLAFDNGRMNSIDWYQARVLCVVVHEQGGRVQARTTSKVGTKVRLFEALEIIQVYGMMGISVH